MVSGFTFRGLKLGLLGVRGLVFFKFALPTFGFSEELGVEFSAGKSHCLTKFAEDFVDTKIGGGIILTPVLTRLYLYRFLFLHVGSPIVDKNFVASATVNLSLMNT